MGYNEELNELEQTVETADTTEEITTEVAQTSETAQDAIETTEQAVEEPAVEATIEPAEETIEEILEDATEHEESLAEEIGVEVAPKKKFPLQIPIIIAACIVVVALLGYFAVSLFMPTVEGTWLYESEEGYQFYYDLDDTKDGKVCDMSIGTVHFPGTYETVVGENTNSISISVYAGYIYGDYTYTMTGNKIAGNRVLTLTAADGTTFTLTQTKAPKDSDYITPDENFKPDESIVGEWEYVYEEYGASLNLKINADGTLIYNQFGYQELHCTYTTDGSTLALSFFETEVIAQEEEYYFDNDQLIFLGVNWTRVDKSTADQA